MPAESPSRSIYRRGWPIKRYVVFLAGLALAAYYTWLSVAPGLRPEVIRLSAVLLCAVILRHGFIVLRQRYKALADANANRTQPSRDVAGDLLRKLLEELRYSRRSYPYFDKTLWPRLQRLETRLTGTRDALSKPAPRRGRGPSLAALRALLHELESRRCN